MNDIGKEIKNKGRDIRLSAMEKEEMRRTVMEFVGRYPVQTHNNRRTVLDILLGGYVFRYAVAGLLVILVSGGGVAIAAEQALPNSRLHAVEINVVEEVQAFFVLGDESKARFYTKRVEERFEEIEKLATTGSVSKEVINQVAVYVEQHTMDVFERLEEHTEEAASVSSDVFSTLEEVFLEHGEKLSELANESEMSEIFVPILNEIDVYQQNIEDVQVVLESLVQVEDEKREEDSNIEEILENGVETEVPVQESDNEIPVTETQGSVNI